MTRRGGHRLWLAPLAAACLLGSRCGKAPPPAEGLSQPQRAVPEVWTTFYPTTYFARRIAGDLVKVVCPLPKDEDPAFWQPDAAALQGYQQADLVVVNGAQFEAFVEQASLPPSRFLAAAQGFADRWIRFENAVTHTHGPGGAAHTHEGTDGHTWVDPVNAKEEADAIRRALARLLPERAEALAAGFDGLAKDLDELDAAFRALGPLPAGQALWTSHPAWNYLAKRYGWATVGLTLDPETPVSDEAIAALRTRVQKQPGTVILWEEAPLPATAERFEKELGLKSVVFPPCEQDEPEGRAEDRASPRDYLSRMKTSLRALAAAFPPR